VIDEMAGSDLEHALEDFVPRWMADTWGFTAVDYSP
jgi:hypothetical protein